MGIEEVIEMNKEFCKYIYECKNVRNKKDCFEDNYCSIRNFYDKWGLDYHIQKKIEDEEGIGAMVKEDIERFER